VSREAMISREKALATKLPLVILKYLRKKFEKLILAYSGGTDSTLLLLLSRPFLDGIVYNNTGLELGETVAYVHKAIDTLGLRHMYVELRPELKPRELAKMVLEIFNRTQGQPYDKHDYRCCWHAKEKPMVQWVRREALDKESTCILRGIRAFDSSQRLMSSMRLISSGHLYHHNFRHCKKAQVSEPLLLLTEDLKWSYLSKLCSEVKLPLPEKTGCAICPIYYRFAKPEERQTDRFKVADRFFARHAKTLITSWAERT